MGAPMDPDVRGEAGNEIPHQYLSAEKARRALGWKPRYGLDGALRETITWYEEYFAAPTIDSYAA
jgi:CDP-glucose 4,6-dehydratase